jgi:hypothetical protein
MDTIRGTIWFPFWDLHLATNLDQKTNFGHGMTTASGTLAHGDLNPPTCCQDDEFHENLIYRGLFRKRSVSLEDTVVSSTTSDPDMAAFQHRRVAAVGTSTGPEDEEDVDEISEARSAPPVVQHDREEISEEDADTMEQEAIQEVLLLLASS